MEKENPAISLALAVFLLLHLLSISKSQQPYENNAQLNCNRNDSSTLGYNCTGPLTTCDSYLIFRSQTNYQSPVQIAYLLNSTAREIADINGVIDVFVFPIDSLVLVPVRCSCYSPSPDGPSYYQHDAYYTIKYNTDTYFIIANNTYQALSTCQAMMQQNPDYDSRHLKQNMTLKVPLRCACPSRNQTTAGYKFLLSYPVRKGDTIITIARRFDTDANAVREANQLEVGQAYYFFTNLLVPLKTPPTKDMVAGTTTLPPSSPPQSPVAPTGGGGGSDKKWVIVGVVIAVFFICLCGVVVFYLCLFRRKHRETLPVMKPSRDSIFTADFDPLSGKDSQSSEAVLSADSRVLIGSLAVYKYGDLRKATCGFDESHRVGGSVYCGTINGDTAAVKRMNGDVSNEIKILQQINHANLVRLSGYCIHEGDTYLVYDFAENGSLADWLHGDGNKSNFGGLSWKQRVQIAYDLADVLNYLHNYATPPCVHKDLKSSSILLDTELRVKLTNFGLARAVADDGATPLQTRHVVGTQGYLSPEYLKDGLVTAKIDVFAFGVVLLELISGKEAIFSEDGGKDVLLSSIIEEVIAGEDARDKLKNFLDARLVEDCPMDSVYAMAQLARRCLTPDPAIRPTMAEVFVVLSAVHSSVLDCHPSPERSVDSLVQTG